MLSAHSDPISKVEDDASFQLSFVSVYRISCVDGDVKIASAGPPI